MNQFKFNYPGNFLLVLIMISLILILLFVANLIVSKVDFQNSDFFSFWLAGRMLLNGESPYSSDLWINNHFKYGATWVSDKYFLYPLPSAILFTPLGLLQLKNASIIWVFLSEVFLVISILLLLLLWTNTIRKHYILPFLAGAFIFRPVLICFHNGQLSTFLLFLITLSIFLWKRKKFWQGGVLLVWIICKTNIGIFILLFIGIWLISRKKLSAIIRLVIFSLIIFLAGMTLDPLWINTFYNTGAGKLKTNFGYSPNLWGLAGSICTHQTDCTMIFGSMFTLIIIFILSYFLLKKISTATLAMSLIISSTLLITPYIWAYDQTLLVFSIVTIAVLLQEHGYPYLLTAVTPIFLSLISSVLLIVSINLGNDSFSAFIPLICFALTIYCASRVEHTQRYDIGLV